MKLFSTLLALIVAATAASAELMVTQNADAATASCTLSGTYKTGTSISTCDSLVISSLTVPAGVTLDLSGAKAGAAITFTGTTTFGEKLWNGPLVLLTGSNLKVSGAGVLDGQGAWYWKQAQSVTRPVFFRLIKVVNSNLSGFTIKNTPYRTFSILNSSGTTLSGLTLDASAGDSQAKNTDGFDLSGNNGVTITGCNVHNQDDCLAMQSSTNTVFSGNTCTGGHGISIGSLGGAAVDSTTTVSGLIVKNNKIINSVNGIRIKTITGLKGLVYNATYTGNVLTNVQNGIVIHSDYSKAQQGYTGSPTSLASIDDVTINGLSGTATTLYSVLVNSKVVSNWSFSGVTVKAGKVGSCSGQPSTVKCT